MEQLKKPQQNQQPEPTAEMKYHTTDTQRNSKTTSTVSEQKE